MTSCQHRHGGLAGRFREWNSSSVPVPELVPRKIVAVGHRNPNLFHPLVLQLLSWATASACLFYGSRLGYATDSAANMTDDGPNVPDSLIDHVEENEISHATTCQPQSSYTNGVGEESGGTMRVLGGQGR